MQAFIKAQREEPQSCIAKMECQATSHCTILTSLNLLQSTYDHMMHWIDVYPFRGPSVVLFFFLICDLGGFLFFSVLRPQPQLPQMQQAYAQADSVRFEQCDSLRI